MTQGGFWLAVKSEGNPELTTSEGLDINVNATVGTNNGTLAVKVQSDGNVGIGTNAAAALLQVETDQIIKGGIVRDGSWHRGLEITTENANYASLFFGNQQTTKYSAIVWTSSTSGNTGNKRGAQIFAHPTSATNTNLAFDTNNAVGTSSPTTKMTILGNGNVGIGVIAPTDPLQVVRTTASQVQRVLALSNFGTTDGTGTRLTFSGYSSTSAEKTQATIVARTIDSDNSAYTSDLRFSTRTTDALVIATDGNVGIGTTAPSVGLQVGNSTSGETKLVVFNSEGGVPAGLTVKARVNRAKLAVSDNDSNAYVIAEGLRAFFGATDSGASTNIAVQTDGNVGIGTTDPAYLFDVSDDSSNIAIFRSSVTNYARVIIRAGAAGDAQLSFQNNTSTKWTIGNDGGDSDKFKIEAGSGAFGTSPLVCILSGGNFGIGTVTPDRLLHIYKATAGSVTATSDSQLVVENSAIAGIQLLGGAGSHGIIYFGDSGNNEDGRIGYDQGDQAFYFKTAGITRRKSLLIVRGMLE